MILDDAQIEAVMQQRINEQWPPAMREKALRMGGQLLLDLNAFFATKTAEKAALIAERDLLVAVADYDVAITRIALPVLAPSDAVSVEDLARDTAERTAAQTVIDSASAEVLAVLSTRSPM